MVQRSSHYVRCPLLLSKQFDEQWFRFRVGTYRIANLEAVKCYTITDWMRRLRPCCDPLEKGCPYRHGYCHFLFIVTVARQTHPNLHTSPIRDAIERSAGWLALREVPAVTSATEWVSNRSRGGGHGDHRAQAR